MDENLGGAEGEPVDSEPVDNGSADNGPADSSAGGGDRSDGVVGGELAAVEWVDAGDVRVALFCGSVAQAQHVAQLGEAILMQTVLAGWDAMLIDERRAGRNVIMAGTAERAFHLHVATVLHLSRQAVQHLLHDALRVRESLPTTWAVLQAGRCGRRAAALAADQVDGLGPNQLAEFDAIAADLVQRLAPGPLQRRLIAAREQLAPEAALQRAQLAAIRRHVAVRPEEDGMGVLEIHAPATDIAALHDGLRQSAVAAHGQPGETRYLGQLMADIACDVLLHGLAADAPQLRDPATPMERISGPDPDVRVPHRTAVQASILVTVPAATAVGESQQPGELAGFGSIDAEITRSIITAAHHWTRVLVDPIDDSVLAIDSHQRHIPTGLRTLLQVRDRVCAGDDCGTPAHRTDLDHIIRYELDGRTRHTNLQSLCRPAHHIKDEGYGKVQLLPDGTVTWRSIWGAVRTHQPAITVKMTQPPDQQTPAEHGDPPF